MSGFEEIVVERGERSGATIAIAVHSTVLGPALGGARMWRYAHADAAVGDAMRLAEAMTHKAAAAGLDLGGGKGVIATPGPGRPEGELRRAMLLDFGDLVHSLEGRYVTAEDVGTGDRDMAVISERTPHVVGLESGRGGSGDPSPVTAVGVRGAMRAGAMHLWGSPDLNGVRVVLVGFGHVGSRLAALLREDGAELVVTDVDPGLRTHAERLGARWVAPEQALTARCDVLAPCALGGLVDSCSLEALRCEMICGAANNVLASEELAERIAERGILYAPDFIANAGGLISVYGEMLSAPRLEALRIAAGIEATMGAILAEAEQEGITPLAAARRRSLERMRAAEREGPNAGAGAVPAGVRLRDSRA